MYVQLNMSIMNIDKHMRRLFCLFFLHCLLGVINIMAQDGIVKSLSKSSLNPIQADVFIYGSGASHKYGSLSFAVNNYSYNNHNIYGTHYDLGIKTELFKRKLPDLRLGASLGYKYMVYAYDRNIFNKYGAHSHWLSPSIDIGYGFFNVGFKSDIYLYSHSKNSNNHSYEGLYKDCFNKMSFSCYLSFNIRFTRFKIEVRLGSDLKPQLNPRKLSYHSMQKTKVDGYYSEILLYYRMFTTGKVHNAPNQIDD